MSFLHAASSSGSWCNNLRLQATQCLGVGVGRSLAFTVIWWNIQMPGTPNLNSCESGIGSAAPEFSKIASFRTIYELACKSVDSLKIASPTLDRRTSPRLAVAVPAQCLGPWGSSPSLISEMSDTGANLVSGRTLVPGEKITLEWCRNAHSPTMRVAGTVKRVGAHSCAIQFMDLQITERRGKSAPVATPMPGKPAQKPCHAMRTRPTRIVCRTKCTRNVAERTGRTRASRQTVKRVRN